MVDALVFDAKIINGKGECDWVGDVPPEAGRVRHFEVAVHHQAFLEELVGQDA